jgi:hypothetical protein
VRSVVIADIRTAIRTNPSTAVNRLSGPDAGVLKLTDRIILAELAAKALRLRVEAGGSARPKLAEVRSARRSANGLDPEVRAELDDLSLVAERRFLAETLADVRAAAEGGRWSDALVKSEDGLRNLSNRPAWEILLESAEFKGLHAHVVEAVNGIAAAGRKINTLDQLQAGVKALEGNRFGEAATALKKVDVGTFPEQLRAATRGLTALTDLGQSAGVRWQRVSVSDVCGLHEKLAGMSTALKHVPGADPLVAKKLAQDLAIKAFLEGHEGAYKALMPGDGPAEHAATLLRDMKAMALGAGKVETWPAQRAMLPEPGEGPASPRGPPPGLKSLVPEGARAGWRPPVRETAKTALPPWEQAAEVAVLLKGKVQSEAAAEKTAAAAKAKSALKHIGAVHVRVLEPEKDEQRKFQEIEAGLHRRLRPAERVTVRAMLAQNKPLQAIVADLPSDDNDREFLAAVSKLLGRALTDEERNLALRLCNRRRRMPDYVAAILRERR